MYGVFPDKVSHVLIARTRVLLTANGGFTLLEVLIALAVIAIIVPAVVGIFVAGSHYISGSSSETVAVKIAQERIEEVKGSMGFSGIDDEALIDAGSITENYGEIGDFPTFKRVTEITFEESALSGGENQLNIARVKVTVYWDGQSNPQHERSIEHETLYSTP